MSHEDSVTQWLSQSSSSSLARPRQVLLQCHHHHHLPPQPGSDGDGGWGFCCCRFSFQFRPLRLSLSRLLLRVMTRTAQMWLPHADVDLVSHRSETESHRSCPPSQTPPLQGQGPTQETQDIQESQQEDSSAAPAAAAPCPLRLDPLELEHAVPSDSDPWSWALTESSMGSLSDSLAEVESTPKTGKLQHQYQEWATWEACPSPRLLAPHSHCAAPRHWLAASQRIRRAASMAGIKKLDC